MLEMAPSADQLVDRLYEEHKQLSKYVQGDAERVQRQRLNLVLHDTFIARHALHRASQAPLAAKHEARGLFRTLTRGCHCDKRRRRDICVRPTLAAGRSV